jgi:hypothetical protein
VGIENNSASLFFLDGTKLFSRSVNSTTARWYDKAACPIEFPAIKPVFTSSLQLPENFYLTGIIP